MNRRLLALLGNLALVLAFPASVLGATHPWAGNGWPITINCDDAAPNTTVWIWTGDSPTALTINGQAQAGSWTQSGNGSWKFVSPWLDSEPNHDTTFVTYTGDAGTLTITHGCGPTPTPTPTPEPTPTPTPTPTPEPTPTPVPIELALVGVCVFDEDGSNDLVWEITLSEAALVDLDLSNDGSFDNADFAAGPNLFSFGVAGDGDLMATIDGTDTTATATEPTEPCTEPPPPPPDVDTGGGLPPPLATVPPTDTVETASVAGIDTGGWWALIVFITIVGAALVLRPKVK